MNAYTAREDDNFMFFLSDKNINYLSCDIWKVSVLTMGSGSRGLTPSSSSEDDLDHFVEFELVIGGSRREFWELRK
jgi:hypothetical protein